MTRAKKIVVFGLWLPFCLAAGTIAFLTLAGDGFYRWAAGLLLERAIDRGVHVAGRFTLSIGSEPRLTATDVWVENASWAKKEEMARAGRIEVQVALWPLLAGTIQVRRLLVQNLALDLERNSDGVGNWQTAEPGQNDPVSAKDGGVSLPLIERVALKDVSVTYRSRQGTADAELLIENLDWSRVRRDDSIILESKGRFNRRDFALSGRFEPARDALAAAAPSPIELTLQLTGLDADLKGTVRNIAQGEGFDVRINARAASIGDFLESRAFVLVSRTHATASATLRGNLDSLAVEDLSLEVADGSGQKLHAAGSLSNLSNGEGLDIAFNAELLPRALQLPHVWPKALRAIWSGADHLGLTGHLSGAFEAPDFDHLQARLTHRSGAELSLDGRLAMSFSDPGHTLTALEASTALSVPDSSEWQEMLGTSLPDFGGVHAAGDLVLEDGSLMLREFVLDAPSFEELRFAADGRLARVSAPAREFALEPLIDVTASMKRIGPLVEFLAAADEESSTNFGIEAVGTASGSSGVASSNLPSLLTETTPPGFRGDVKVLSIQQGLKAAGIDPGPLDGLMGPRTRSAIERYQAAHDLRVNGEASMDLLQHLRSARVVGDGRNGSGLGGADWQIGKLQEAVSDLEARLVSARIIRDDDDYRLDGLHLALGKQGDTWIEATGALGAMNSEPLFKGLALTVGFSFPDSAAWSQVLPPGLPPFATLDGRFDAHGSMDALSISKARVEMEADGELKSTADGQIARVFFLPKFGVEGIDVELRVNAPTTTGLFALVDVALPELGPVAARAVLKDRGSLLVLDAIDVSAGQENRPAAHVTGRIGDLLASEMIELTGNLRMELAPLLHLDEGVEELTLGILQAHFELSDAKGSLNLSNFSAEVVESDLLSLIASGRFDDILEDRKLRLKTSVSVPDFPRLSAALKLKDNSVPNVTLVGEISGSGNRLEYEGELSAGETHFLARLEGSLSEERPSFRGSLYAPALNLTDIGLLQDPEDRSGFAADESPKEEPMPGPLFGEDPIYFDALGLFDLDLSIEFDNVKGIGAGTDQVEAKVKLADGRLEVYPLIIYLPEGRVESKLVADANGDVPSVNIDVVADDVGLESLLAQLQSNVLVDGELDLIVRSAASGRSLRELAESMDGEVSFAIAEGRIHTSLLDLTVSNPIRWLFSRSARRGYSELNCFVARFDVEDGWAQTDDLVLDTTNVYARGNGNVDLRTETVDIVFNPRTKRRRLFAISTPFSIRGSLSSPVVEVNSAMAATRLTAKTIAGPVNFLGSLLPLVRNRGSNSDNACLLVSHGAN